MTPAARMLGTVLDILETAASTRSELFVPLTKLCHLVTQRLGVSPEAAAAGVRSASESGHVVLRGERVYLSRLDASAQRLSDCITDLRNGGKPTPRSRHTAVVLELRAQAQLEAGVELALQLSCELASTPAGRQALAAVARDSALRERATQAIARASALGARTEQHTMGRLTRAVQALAKEV